MATKPRKRAPKAPKTSANPIGDFLKGEADKRKLPVVTEQKPRARGNPNRANPPKTIHQGHTPGSSSRAVVPYEAPAKKPSRIGAVARGIGRVAGPVGALVAMTTPAGEGSDKPKGPLFSPSKNRAAGKGNPKTVNPYKKPTGAARPETPGRYPKANPSLGIGEGFKAPSSAPATSPPKPKAKPAREAPKPAERPSFEKGPASKTMAYTAPATKKRGNVFSGKNDPIGPRKDASGKNASYGFKSVKDLLRGKRAK